MPSMDYFLAHEDEIKSQCKVTKSNGAEDSCTVKLKKDGYVFYIEVDYYYEYYGRTASYYEPAEESYTLEGIKDWVITDIEKDSDDYKVSEEEFDTLDKKYSEEITEDEIIELVLKETGMGY